MPLARNVDDLRFIVGETVYKIGTATGLTLGRLRSAETTFRSPTSRQLYRKVVEVEWMDECPFGVHGDCGSIYCVNRRGDFCPIAIHRVSEEVSKEVDGVPGKVVLCSYGSSFRSALQIIESAIETDLAFVNAPYAKAL